MNRKLFNSGLYLDSLRRTSLLGGLFTALLCIQSAIIFFGYMIGYQGYDFETAKISVETVSLIEMNPCILLIPVALIPLLMLTLFGFLNSRSTSDFWHSTPFSRECLYITFTLAALTWALAAAVLSTAISVLCFSLMPKLFAINFASVFGLFFSSIALCLLVAGAFAIASALTGTLLNTLVVAAIILFLPRVLMVYFGTLTSNGMLFYGLSHEGFASVSLNLLIGLVFGVFFGEVTVTEMLANYTSIGYTALLGVIYLALGIILFKRRKSESASYSSVNKYMQTAFRIIVSFIVCLIPIYIITERNKDARYGMDIEQVFVCFVLYVVAAVVYFLYELITTKKAKNMLKAIPSLAILAVLNIAMIVAINQTYKAEYNYTPTPQTVSTIRISDKNGGDTENYFEKVMSMTDISDHNLETLLCDLYAKTREAYENDTIYSKYETSISVGFKTGNRYKYREVYMTDEQLAQFTELLDKNNQIKSIYNIDNILKDAVHTDLSVYLGESFEISDTDRKKLITTYVNDVKKLSFNEWYHICSSPYDNSYIYTDGQEKYFNSVGEIYISINVKGSTYYVNLPIDDRMTNTYDALMNQLFKQQNKENLQTTILEQIKSDKNIDKDVYVELYNGSTNSSPEGYSLQNLEITQKFIDAVTPALGELPNSKSRIATLHYYTHEEDLEGYEFKSHTCIFKVPDDADLSFFLDIKE